MKRFFQAVALFSLIALQATALDLGDAAPQIFPAKWITGSEVDPTTPDDKTIFLVEVWSTTCPPCVRSIPILNDLQKRYVDEDLKIVSFTTDEESEILPFLEMHPMEYASFVDTEAQTYINYMAADNRNTIPHAFLFDRSGRLVWIGNPLDNVEEKIKQVLDGTLNGDKATAIRSARDRLQSAFEEQNMGDMLSALVELEDLEPTNPQFFQLHYRLLSQFGGDREEIAGLLRSWFKGANDNAESLVILSMVAIEQGLPEHRDPELALEAAKRAFSIDSSHKFEAGLTLSEVYKSLGRLDLAIEVLDKLIELGDAEEREFLETVRAFSQKSLDLGKALAGIE
ncbi:MAG: TlpA family protein disulfide reductase [Planctomycetota bacterium]|nr:TlpA family protein disulfide reductase [Planctomycetota bacterium]